MKCGNSSEKPCCNTHGNRREKNQSSYVFFFFFKFCSLSTPFLSLKWILFMAALHPMAYTRTRTQLKTNTYINTASACEWWRRVCFYCERAKTKGKCSKWTVTHLPIFFSTLPYIMQQHSLKWSAAGLWYAVNPFSWSYYTTNNIIKLIYIIFMGYFFIL